MKKSLSLLFLSASFFASAQWTQQTSGTTNDLNEIFFPVDDTGFVVGRGGTLLRTFNGGAQWSALNSGTTQNLNDVFFLNTQQGFIVGDSGFFARTANGGNTWNGTYISNPDSIDLGCVYFTDAMTGYVGGSENFNAGVILKTTNGGSSWSISNTPVSNMSILYKRLAFPTADTGYALTRGMCMKTIDAGNNWFITDTNLVNSGSMFSILEDAHFFSPDTGYIVGWYNPFSGYTVNGYNWADQFIGANQWFAVEFPSRQVGYMVGWGELYKTTNGGQGWWDITTPLVQGDIHSMCFTDINTGYCCGGQGLIIKTIMGGTASVTDDKTGLEIALAPNPVTHHGLLRFNRALGGMITISDMLGKVLRTDAFSATHEVKIEKNDLQPGIYLVTIAVGGFARTLRMAVQ